jgi:adhesin transport system outer membrane protein
MLTLRTFFALAVVSAGTLCAGVPTAGAQSVRDAVAAAVRHNPQIQEAAHNRRAVDEELNQGRGLYLPRLDLEASAGFQYSHRPGNDIRHDSRWGDQIGLVGRRTLFDGGFRAAEVDKQTARVAGAAVRVRERSELIALEAIQAYLDITRFNTITKLSDDNLAAIRELVRLVQTRVAGGLSTQGEVLLAQERVHAAEATRVDVKRTLGAAEARFVNVVGKRPSNLHTVNAPSGVPKSREAALGIARSRNPTLLAAERDVHAARADLTQSEAAFRPTIALEGRASAGHDLSAIPGPNHEASAKLLLNWNLFNGHIDQARRRERAERLGEIESRRDRLRRDVDEAVARAWSDLTTTDERLGILARQIETGRSLIASYRQEFEANRRSMLDLLEAQNVYFNARVQQATAKALATLARYQLVATGGGLLAYFNIAQDVESEEDVRDWNRNRSDRPELRPLLRH